MWTLSNKKYGVAVYNFDGGQVSNGLSLNVGDAVCIVEECAAGWIRGCTTSNKHCKGIFPSSYIHTKDLSAEKGSDYYEDALINELTFTIRDWSGLWKTELFVKEDAKCVPVKKIMLELVKLRKELMTHTLASNQMKELRQNISNKIDWMNKWLKLDVVPRLNGELVDPDVVGPVKLYNIHTPRKLTPTMLPSYSRGHHISYQLFMQLRSLQCQVGVGDSDKIEVFFSLYNSRESKFMCERILCRVDKDGKWTDADQAKSSFCCMMVDLTSEECHADLFIVAHVYRVGSLLLKDGFRKAKHIAYKRPVGCAVLGISDVLHGLLDLKEERDYVMKIVQCNDGDFPSLADSIIRKQTVKEPRHGSAGVNSAITISLRLLHGELSSVRKKNPMLFTKGLVYSQPLAVRNLSVSPDAIRNDFYITLNRGDFDKGSKTSGLNVEVKVALVHRTEGQVEGGILSAVGDVASAEYKSVVLYHNSQPRWNETIRVAFSTDALVDLHVRFEFRHCSADAGEKKFIAFAFLKVTDAKGALVMDGTHELFVYRVTGSERVSECLSHPYVDLPCMAAATDHGSLTAGGAIAGGGTAASAHFTRSAKDSFHVDTLLCSVRHTQNVKLLNFFKWRDHMTNLQEVLEQFKMAEANEVMKFCSDIFTILFEMFPAAGQHESLVFDTLVHVLQLLNEEQYKHLKSLCDSYIQTDFAAPLAFRYLLKNLRHLLDSRNFEGSYSVLRASRSTTVAPADRVLGQLFKFIVQAAILYRRSSGDERNKEFYNELNAFWASACALLSIPVVDGLKDAAAVRKAQAALLDALPSTVDSLLRLLPPKDVANKIAAAVSSPSHDDQIMLLPRLQCTRKAVGSPIFEDNDARQVLLGICTAQLKACFLHVRYANVAVETLAELLTSLHCHRASPTSSHCTHILVSVLLDVVVATVLEYLCCDTAAAQTPHNLEEKDTEWGHGERKEGLLVACLIGLFDAMDEEHFDGLVMRLPTRDVQKQFTVRLLAVLLELTSQKLIRPDWTVMLMEASKIVLKTVQILCHSLSTSFLKDDDFDETLWRDFFELGIRFITQRCLQLDKLSESKAEKLRERYQDMRLLMCHTLLLVWQKLGDRRQIFIPNFVGPFLEVSLIPEPELRQAVLPVFFDLMLCEQKACGNFKKVEAELIDKLDMHINKIKGDGEFLERFQTILLQRTDSEHLLREEGSTFVKCVSNLLERLLDYRQALQQPDGKEAHILATLNVLDFYKKEIHREELYTHYVYKLADLHLEAQSYTEAAFTLMLCASGLGWGSQELLADSRFPAQKEWERKQTLYEQAIQYFEKGEAYVHGIPLCKELANFYEKKLFDYARLGAMLRTESKLFDNILSREPDGSYYFRVAFIGRRFSTFLQNKVFVYRGDAFDKLPSVTRKLSAEFPNAQILNPNINPTDDMKNGEVQYVQLCAVQPLCTTSLLSFSDAMTPVNDRLKAHINYSFIDHFQYDRAFHMDNKKNEKNEFKSLCLSRTTLQTVSPLPGELRWSEVASASTEELSPIEVAIDAVQRKNKDLQKAIQEFADEKVASIQPLSMQLGGVIDAAVNGGISKYQEAFFATEYICEYPAHADHTVTLKKLFVDQVRILTKGLALHCARTPEDMKPFHDNLAETFKKMKHSLHNSTDIDISDADESSSVDLQVAAAVQSSADPVVAASASRKNWLKELNYNLLQSPPGTSSSSSCSSVLDTNVDDSSLPESSGYCSSDVDAPRPPELPKKDYDTLGRRPSVTSLSAKALVGAVSSGPPLPRKMSMPAYSIDPTVLQQCVQTASASITTAPVTGGNAVDAESEVFEDIFKDTQKLGPRQPPNPLVRSSSAVVTPAMTSAAPAIPSKSRLRSLNSPAAHAPTDVMPPASNAIGDAQGQQSQLTAAVHVRPPIRPRLGAPAEGGANATQKPS